MQNDALVLVFLMFGLMFALSVYARLMHKSARNKVKLCLRQALGTAIWWFLKAKWSLKGRVYDLYDYVRRSPRFSPHLYLPSEPFYGPMSTFLGAVRQHPAYGESARQRLYRLIRRQGINHSRTFEIRYLYGEPSLIAWNAFNNMPEADPRMLSGVVEFLSKRTCERPILVLAGASSTGKTQLLERFRELLREAEPVAAIEGSHNRANPLQILYLLHDYAALRYKDTPTVVAVRELLDELGLAGLIDADNKGFAAACREARVTPDLAGLASIEKPEHLACALFELLGVRNAQEAVPPPTVYERRLMLASTFLPQDARVNTWQHDDNQGYVLLTPRVDCYSCVSELSRYKFHMLGHVASDSPLAEDWDTEGHRAHRGLMVIPEGLRNPIRFLNSLLKLGAGYLDLACGEEVRWEGVIALMVTPEDVKQFCQSRESSTVIDRCFLVRAQRTVAIDELERLLEQKWKIATRNRNDNLDKEPAPQLDPLLIPYLARVGALSNVPMGADEALNRLDPHRRLAAPRLWELDVAPGISSLWLTRIIGEAAARDYWRKQPSVQPMSVEEARRWLLQGAMTPNTADRVRSAIVAADEWLAQPHPFIKAKAKTLQVWNDRRYLLGRLVEWYRNLSRET